MLSALHTTKMVRLFALLLVILTWPACDPDMPPAPTCDDDIPSVAVSDGPCSAQVLEFSNLVEQQAGTIPLLADFCVTDYSRSRVLRIPPESIGSVEALVIYANFPGQVTVEILGSNCQGNLPFLIECFTVGSVAEVLEINLPTSSEDILVRVVAEANGSYEPGTSPNDAISISALTDVGSPGEFENGDIIACSEDRLQRLVISGPAGVGFEAAEALGLPIAEECRCSNGDLLSVDVPYGVDLETLRPKTRDRVSTALNDTTELGIDFDLLLDIFPRDQLSGYDVGDDTYINSEDVEECYLFSEGATESPLDPEDGLTVAFIDSGYDFANWGGIMSSVQYQGETPDCWADAGFTFSEFGFDFLNAVSLPADVNGHGTDVASAFYSNFSAAAPLSILHFKFFGSEKGSYFDALCGSYVAEAAGADIINWSWGFLAEELPVSLANVLRHLREQGVIVVAAAGNNSAELDTEPLYPAAASPGFNNLLTVGSYAYLNYPGSIEPEKPFFSNFSAQRVDLAAYATVQTPLANSAAFHSPVGTSISAPLLTRQLAEYWAQDPGLNYEDVINDILSQVLDHPNLTGFTRDERYLQFGCIDGALPQP